MTYVFSGTLNATQLLGQSINRFLYRQHVGLHWAKEHSISCACCGASLERIAGVSDRTLLTSLAFLLLIILIRRNEKTGSKCERRKLT